MQTKLTLRVDQRLVRKAKAYARRSGKSVSAVVSDLFVLLDEPVAEGAEALSPAVRSLLGALARGRLDEDGYRRYLEAKHG
ncbi:MAG: antitoxin [Deltaproteobacteria bacterium]|nr:antitoxin [Deltaproteobacteria bacterium]